MRAAALAAHVAKPLGSREYRREYSSEVEANLMAEAGSSQAFEIIW
jgi:hypothetical protein